jgi:hypothetical protein
MSKKQYHQSVRELELSRSLARLLSTMPYGVVSSLLESLLLECIKTPSGVDIKFGVETEAHVFKSTPRANGRADVYVPLSFPETKITGVVFETKLGYEDARQLIDYSRDGTKLIVSISKTIKDKSLEKKYENIILITWLDLLECMFPLLSMSAQERLLKGRSPVGRQRIQPDYPPFYIGMINENILEYFLLDIVSRNLINLRPKNRVMVVSGAFASEMAIKHGIAGVGTGWDHQFSYYCVVHQKRVNFIGAVEKIYSNLNVQGSNLLDEGVSIPKHDSDLVLPFIKDLSEWKSNTDRDVGDEVGVVFLRDLNQVESHDFERNGIAVGKSYPRRGAITQSHRYFNSPKELGALFSE